MSTRTSRDQISSSTTTVMVVDDHRTFTDLMLLALHDVDDLQCVGAAHDRASALELAAMTSPDVVLMDVELGDEDGLEVAEQLVAARPGLRVVVLTAHAQDVSIVRRAAGSGACALLPKDGSLPELLHHLRTARPGGMVVQRDMLQAMVAPGRPPTTPTRHGSTKSPFTALTARENHVLALLARGYDVRRIAGELQISVHTCRGYVKSVLAKLGAHSQLEAVVIANTHGLVSGPRIR